MAKKKGWDDALPEILFRPYLQISHPDLIGCIKLALMHQADDGSLVAQVADVRDPPTPSARVWRFRAGRFLDESPEALEKALGDNRADWPRRTSLFQIDRVLKTKAQVTVVEHYSSGLTAGSRGGQFQQWEFGRSKSGWRPRSKKLLMIWD
jgi:hypothetical protein